jgi:predicted transcriptional regulator
METDMAKKKQNKMLENLFLRDKPALILLGMKTKAKDSVYATILAKEANCTYSHTIKILNLFQQLGLVKFEKTGRIKKVMLTDDGWDIAHNLEAMTKKFSQIEDGVDKKAKDEKKKPAPKK